jgi:hypothetical protein
MLLLAIDDLIVSSPTRPAEDHVTEPVEIHPGVFHLGEPGATDTRMLVGYCTFWSNDAALLVSLLPDLVVIRDQRWLTTLVELLSEESRADRPGRDEVLARLLEVLLIEAFRVTPARNAAPGLLRGLPRSGSQRRCAGCTASRRARGPSPSWRGRPACRAPPSSTGFGERSALLRWSI